jgi:hypothetical protein
VPAVSNGIAENLRAVPLSNRTVAHSPDADARDMAASRPRRPWAGTALLGIALLHVTFVLVLGSGAIRNPQMSEWVGNRAPFVLMRPGFGSDQPSNLLLLTLFWSLFFGLVLAIVGALVRHIERSGNEVPRYVGGVLFGLGLVGAVLVPASGFWFVLVPAWKLMSSARGACVRTC